MKKVTKEINIQITNDAGNVALTTFVGNGNKGGGNVKNEQGQKIARGLLNNFPLGSGADLTGKKITVTTNVLDINPFRDDTPIFHKFIGSGLNDNTNNFTEDADSDGIVAFVIEYTFTK